MCSTLHETLKSEGKVLYIQFIIAKLWGFDKKKLVVGQDKDRYLTQV